MENRDILLLRHHPMNVLFTNPFYTAQSERDLSEFIILDVTSRVERNKKFLAEHPTFGRDLSPFFVGPVTASDGTRAEIFEIFWQCGKVYPCHDDGGKPNAAFFAWRKEFYEKSECTKDVMRHACKSLGYAHSDCRYFAYFDKEKGDYVPLSFVEARKRVYFPEYAKLIYNTRAMRWMQSLLADGKKLALVDFDGYNYNESCAMRKKYEQYVNSCRNKGRTPTVSQSDFLAIGSMKDAVDCPFLSAGHSFVIKALLQGDLAVENGEVIDRAGILE